MLCIPQKLIERGAGTRSDDVKSHGLDIFHPDIANFRIQFQPVTHSLHKSAFFSCRFHKRDLGLASHQFCQHEPRKAGAAAQVDERSGIFGDVFRELGAVPDMPPPDVCERTGRDEIVAAVPVLQHPDIGLQAGQCFT